MYNLSEQAAMKFEAHSYRSVMGKSSMTIDCPFCGTSFVAYIWSISGGGKCCTNKKCGAKHTSHGMAHPRVGRESMRPGSK